MIKKGRKMLPQYEVAEYQLLVRRVTDTEQKSLYPNIESLQENVVLARIEKVAPSGDLYNQGEVVLIDVLDDAIKVRIDGRELFHIHEHDILGKIVEE